MANNDYNSGKASAVKFFMVLTCIASLVGGIVSIVGGNLAGGIIMIISLVWGIPMTVHARRCLNDRKYIGQGFKICTLIFHNLLAGVILLCMKTDGEEKKTEDKNISPDRSSASGTVASASWQVSQQPVQPEATAANTNTTEKQTRSDVIIFSRALYRRYLIERGYSLVTPSGNPSTVDDYCHRVDFVCNIENIEWADLPTHIERILQEYGSGGIKQSLVGAKSNNSVINALRRVYECINTQINTQSDIVITGEPSRDDEFEEPDDTEREAQGRSSENWNLSTHTYKTYDEKYIPENNNAKTFTKVIPEEQHKWTDYENEFCVRMVFYNFVYHHYSDVEGVVSDIYDHLNGAIKETSIHMKLSNIKHLLIEYEISNTLNVKALYQVSSQCMRAFRKVNAEYEMNNYRISDPMRTSAEPQPDDGESKNMPKKFITYKIKVTKDGKTYYYRHNVHDNVNNLVSEDPYGYIMATALYRVESKLIADELRQQYPTADVEVVDNTLDGIV